LFWLARTTDAFRGYVDAEDGYDPDSRKPYAPISIERHNYGFTVRKGDERYAKRGMSNPQHPDGRRPGTVMTHAVGAIRGSRHPALMALDLAGELVRCACPLGGVVLDPFAGWATTGVAARRAGRRFVGVELRPGYFEDAARRLERWDVDARWSPPPRTPEGDEHPALFGADDTVPWRGDEQHA
jgi:DNA modification methylase